MHEAGVVAKGLRRDGLGNTEVTMEGIDAPGKRVAALRGATVDVDMHRAGRVVAGLCVLALATTGLVLLAAGVQKNAQITRLHQQGVAVEATVTRCIGLMGGSGSDAAGYECTATFTLNRRRYNDAIPGNTLFAPGTSLRAIVVPGDPALLSTPRALATEHSSWRVFILPAALLVLLVLFIGAWAIRRGNNRRVPPRVRLVSST